jgi:hypothetical protein
MIDVTYHGHGVRIGSGLGIPLHRDLTSRAGVRAVVAGLARLVRAHGPTGVLLIGSDRDETGVGWELALTTTLLNGDILGAAVEVRVAVAGSFSARNEGDERSSARGSDVELHVCDYGLVYQKSE